MNHRREALRAARLYKEACGDVFARQRQVALSADRDGAR
jgi:hypothetical protein